MLAQPCSLERTHGSLRLGFASRDGVTVAHETFQSGALRVRFSKSAEVCEAIVLNTAGGLTGGDVLDLEIRAAAKTHAVVTTQACERIYRSVDDAATINTAIAAGAGATLEYLPQPTILFDEARLRRETIARVASDSRLLAIEACILGRTAMNEEVRAGSVRDAWRIERDGRLVFADAIALADDVIPELGAPWMLGGARAYATLLYVAPDAASRLEELREVLADTTADASFWNGLIIARLVAADGYALTHTLSRVLQRFRGGPLPRSWVL